MKFFNTKCIIVYTIYNQIKIENMSINLCLLELSYWWNFMLYKYKIMIKIIGKY